MASSDVEAVLMFLRKNGLRDAEMALKQDMMEKTGDREMGSFDFEKFLFPIVPPPPPVRIPVSLRRSEIQVNVGGSSSVSDDEFMSLDSNSACGVCSSEFITPYGRRSTSPANSDASSDKLSQFGTARDYPDFDMQNDLYWYDDKDGGYFMTPSFKGSDFFGCPSEDKFITTSVTDKQFQNPLNLHDKSDGFLTETSIDYLDKPCLLNVASVDDENVVRVMDYYHFDKDYPPGGSTQDFCKCCGRAEGYNEDDVVDYNHRTFVETDSNNFHLKGVGEIPTDFGLVSEQTTGKDSSYSGKRDSRKDWLEEYKCNSDLHAQVKVKGFMENGIDNYELEAVEVVEEPLVSKATADEVGNAVDELLMYNNLEDEYEVFNLRIIHRKNRTGFEEHKDLPIVLNTVIAGRYYVTEYIGSAAFSKVVQAQDLHTGTDVCLKIIKNDKDFFDQSLDEIKLLKFVNKYDPADERHLLRLYDYFYHQEHLFIVCELLRANLYEFQKFNQESGGDAYFTLSRLQHITRQCLEALEYLHHLGIIHCDLNPENILIKSYRRCEIKVIDLGSSCFQTDNLCLYVQSRSYRAPEVILGLPYDQKIDLWSLGCILAELCSGEVLFPNDAIVVILARMIGMLGPIDLNMLVMGQETDKYFTKEYDLYFINEETDQIEIIIPEESCLEHHLQVFDAEFIDFIRNLLQVDPLSRLTAREALEHPWLSHLY
ncbi:Pkinase domain-containing protein [Cephalotus follicularis]|uniref:Pkinase domain-containing protein n=1 Tax=Cephalotus follicularis TaxID=3775 RepID=A0A1Q3BAS2_CEPFO|nr:Pkinase domain-containing protein [Cephalotus follicularis]